MKEHIKQSIILLKSFPLKKKLAVIGLIFIAAIAIPLTLIVSQIQQETRSRASTPVVTNALYVSPSGNDSNAGTKDSPFATINKAAAMATPGTVVQVAPGTYNETVITNTSGTRTSRIKFISDGKWGAKIVSSGTAESTDSTWENNGDYIDIQGFDISGGKRIGILNRASFVKITGNKVHDVAVGYCESLGGAGIDSAYSPDQQGNEYTGNLVEKVGPKPCSYVHGIYIQSQNEKVINNIVVNNGGIGIACTHGCNSPVISNNTVVNNGYGIRIGWSQTNASGKTENAIVTNNIIVGHSGYSFYQYSQGLGSNNQFSNNLFYNNKSNGCTSSSDAVIPCSASLVSDPQFISANDFHISQRSSAIDSGIKLGAPQNDYDDNKRPQGKSVDVGAFESINPKPAPKDTTSKPPDGCYYDECYSSCPPEVPCIAGCERKLICPTPSAKPTAVPASPTPSISPDILSGDVNNDKEINVSDYLILMSCSIYSKSKALCSQNPKYKTSSDLNSDGKIDLDDMTILVKLLSTQR